MRERRRSLTTSRRTPVGQRPSRSPRDRSPSLAEAADVLRDRGATRLVVAPWFLAHGRITDRVANFARANGIAMAEPLGPHRLVAETVLDRFDEALDGRAAA